jgi:hypothetical protein
MHVEFKGKATDVSYRTMVIMIGSGDVATIVKYIVRHVDYLGPSEVSQNFITKWAQGRYVPLLELIGDEDIVTKDPNDSLMALRAMEEARKLAAKR